MDVDYKVRRQLIEQARDMRGRYLPYEDAMATAGLDRTSARDRDINADMLGAISAYEHQRGRPLLSAIAMYKDGSGHGKGFYKVAAHILGRSEKKLEKEFFAITQMKAVQEFWKNEDNYAKYAVTSEELQTVSNDDTNSELRAGVPFFTTEEMNVYHSYAGSKYDDGAIGNDIKSTINVKVRYWQERLLSRFNMAHASVTDRWQQSGSVKKYIWGRLNRPEHQEADVFFTIDAMGEENRLKVRLGYNFSNTKHFSGYQEERIREIISPELLLAIPAADLSKWNWERLIRETIEVIDQKWNDYEEAVRYSLGTQRVTEASRSRLLGSSILDDANLREPLDDSPIDPTGSGQDFMLLAQRRHDIGEEGEAYVLGLLQVEIPERTFTKMIPGSRYDICGKLEGMKDMEIEVKATTATNEGTPFYMSASELEYAEQTINNYYLYRVTGLGTDQQRLAYRLTRDELLKRTRTAVTFSVEGK